MVTYLAQVFSPYAVAFVFVSLLAAGLSTLDGILVSISSVVVSDLFLAFGKHGDEEERAKKGLALSRYVLVAIGLIALVLAWDPPKSLGLFAQQGVYALVAAFAAPVILGILRPSFRSATAALSLALLAVGLHFGLCFGFGVQNPSVSASWAMLVSVGLGAVLPASAEAPASRAT